MNETTHYIRETLLSKSKSNPLELEERVNPYLVVAPIAKKSAKLKPKKYVIDSKTSKNGVLKHLLVHNNYRMTNKLTKLYLNYFIKSSNHSIREAHEILTKNDKIKLEKHRIYEYLKNEKEEIFKKIPVSYETLLQKMFREMWIPYIHDALKIDSSRDYKENLTKLNINVCLNKLSICDFNGCRIKVIKSENLGNIGKEGIVLWDSQKTFIITENNLAGLDSIKIINKSKTIFEIRLPIAKNGNQELIFHIIGDRLMYRSSDRVGKKFKNKNVKDLMYYINANYLLD
ncbi:unnamed protein product [Hanseniaspora opuntiae]